MIFVVASFRLRTRSKLTTTLFSHFWLSDLNNLFYSITLLFVRLPGIFIAEIFRELVLFYPRGLSEGHVLVAKKAMESANIIHPISHELLT